MTEAKSKRTRTPSPAAPARTRGRATLPVAKPTLEHAARPAAASPGARKSVSSAPVNLLAPAAKPLKAPAKATRPVATQALPAAGLSVAAKTAGKTVRKKAAKGPAAAQAGDEVVGRSARVARALVPAAPESAAKPKVRRKRLSKAFPMPLEENNKKARKKELKRVLKALQSLTDAGMVSGRYSLPADEYARFTELRRRLEAGGTAVKKNSLVRAGLALLAGLDTPTLLAALAVLPAVPDDAEPEAAGRG